MSDSPRTPWRKDFPPVVLHAAPQARTRHPLFEAAKSGDLAAALSLAQELIDPSAMSALQDIAGGNRPILLAVSALEVSGFNAIPDAMAQVLADQLNWPISAGDIVQNNKVGHTLARAFNRLVTPAAFEGPVLRGAEYVLVDDHVGLGGTLANLKGHIETQGGRVLAMTTLTESRQARQIALQDEVLDVLRNGHGEALEELWQGQFGHGLECLTNVEGTILCREPTVDAIRGRLAQAAVEVRERGLAPGIPDRP